jgi:hypothetical protein
VMVLPRAQLQEITTSEIEALILSLYAWLMHRFLVDRALIPPERIVELSYEDLEEQPLDQMRMVYDRLGLRGFAQAEPGFRSYLYCVAGYKNTEYVVVVAKIKWIRDRRTDHGVSQTMARMPPREPGELAARTPPRSHPCGDRNRLRGRRFQDGPR